MGGMQPQRRPCPHHTRAGTSRTSPPRLQGYYKSPKRYQHLQVQPSPSHTHNQHHGQQRSLGKNDWQLEDWVFDSERWTHRENEILDFNPNIHIVDRPKWIKFPSALHADKKEKSSIIVAIEKNDWVAAELKKPHPCLAIHGLRCSFRKYIKKDSSIHCERCLQYRHHAAHGRLEATCKYCNGNHYTKDHICMKMYCTAGKGRSCLHTVRRCVNSDETSHFTGSTHCLTRTRALNPTTAEKGKAPAKLANTNPHK